MDTTEITTLLEDRSAAIRARDLDRLLSFYSDDIVYFDVVPPLCYAGIDALRGRFADWFARWASPIGQDIADLHVETGGDVAAVHMLIRTSGTLATGREVGYWVRAGDTLRRTADGWAIAHEHVSLPVEFPSGTAAMDLRPPPTGTDSRIPAASSARRPAGTGSSAATESRHSAGPV